MVAEFITISLPIVEELNSRPQRLTLHLHPEVVAALQFAHGHPRATLLYLRLLIHPAQWHDGSCEILVPSHQALLVALQSERGWQRLQPLLQDCMSELSPLPAWQAASIAERALQPHWTEILRRTRQHLRTQLRHRVLTQQEERALQHLFANHALRWQVGQALAPLLSHLPFVSCERQRAQLRQWQEELQTWDIVETELAWLEEAALLTRREDETGLRLTLTPQQSPAHRHMQTATSQEGSE
jgi:hypothetical protein